MLVVAGAEVEVVVLGAWVVVVACVEVEVVDGADVEVVEVPWCVLVVSVRARFALVAQAALEQPNGPSYEFFKPLIPPLHYVNADFRHYPIVLSAPRSAKVTGPAPMAS